METTSTPSAIPALGKVRKIIEAKGLSMNAFERGAKLGRGQASRILGGLNRPGAPVIVRIQRWSKGAVDLLDWLTPEEVEAARSVTPPSRRVASKARAA